MRRAFLVCALPLLMAGTMADEVAKARNTPWPSSQEAAENAVKAWLGQELRDPERARYRFRQPVRSVLYTSGANRPSHDGSVYLCGEVNAPNGYGGMSGWRTIMAKFHYDRRDVVAGVHLDEPGQPQVIRRWCDQAYRDAVVTKPLDSARN